MWKKNVHEAPETAVLVDAFRRHGFLVLDCSDPPDEGGWTEWVQLEALEPIDVLSTDRQYLVLRAPVGRQTLREAERHPEVPCVHLLPREPIAPWFYSLMTMHRERPELFPVRRIFVEAGPDPEWTQVNLTGPANFDNPDLSGIIVVNLRQLPLVAERVRAATEEEISPVTRGFGMWGEACVPPGFVVHQLVPVILA
ncbi:hypothetical protein A2348_01265 [Candidatus Uhrbacteria bacterium RIFOXYB12_FULL_58_10]|uniref:Uncharacterized protein n=1 Tax=Candidatus Uhrbacteria bacterium RIFOXYB2_FULL_57_15 TaxID=1802422 RepID=A0A1F7W8X0_9BACT|nr:MAG: hypothetical protein A2348_01265 [Candidatus Uhrbacteria bacterium RIFOXYB12_FULL_58_10]OGL99046.1 MAG: hypothetical protein A2304_02780 [Candidatus Uhrbacteria bacterium RIFOXYB2_FULL_57_15]OGM00267.1 MAG: hypothetical protein A2501_01910 [Candidatus Uhrbacteria bacterium RIFOXYC12_FULL_57_11]